MNEFEDDEVLARLRAADPAQGAHPDLHRLSAHLRERTPLGNQQQDTRRQGLGQAAGHSFSHTTESVVRVKDHHTRTGRGGLLVAASVAALALAGGGYAVGAGVAGDDAQGTLAAQETDGPGDAHAASDGGAMEDYSSAENYTASQDSDGGGYLGPVIPVAGAGLSTERTTGAVYAPAEGDATGAADQLRPYAEGLGLEGEVQDYGAGADLTDATDGRSLSLSLQGGLTSFDYSNPALDSWCQETMDETKDLGYSPFGEGGPQEIECATLGDPPSEDQAISEAQELLDQAGVDHSGYDFSAEQTFGWFDTEPELGDEASATMGPRELEEHYAMIADQMIADEEITEVSVIASDPDSPVGDYRTWHFSVTSDGVSSASVQLGELTELGDYEVISATEAVERANDVRFQQLGVYIPDLEYDEFYGEEWEEPEPLPAVQPGGPIPFPLGEATVTKAELHTGVLSLWDGTEFLVPTWNLTDADGNSWQVLGLTEDALDFTP